jgi:Ni2+-binding GTPase involved in maturation of urease and hydrogenase
MMKNYRNQWGLADLQIGEPVGSGKTNLIRKCDGECEWKRKSC